MHSLLPCAPMTFRELPRRTRQRVMSSWERWMLVSIFFLLIAPLFASAIFELLVHFRGTWGIRQQSWLIPTLTQTAQTLGRDLLPIHWCLFFVALFGLWSVMTFQLLFALPATCAHEVWQLTRLSTTNRLITERLIECRGKLTHWDLQLLRRVLREEIKSNKTLHAHAQRRWARLHHKDHKVSA